MSPPNASDNFTPSSNPPRPPVPDATGKAAAPASLGLSPEQKAALVRANVLYKSVSRAISVASTDASIMAFFAVGSLLMGLLSSGGGFSLVGHSGPQGGIDFTGIIMGVFLSIVAFNSIRGVRRFKRLDSSGARLLAINQLFLAVGVIIYAAWSYHALMSTDVAAQMSQLGGALDKDTVELLTSIPKILYGSLALGTLIAQPLTAVYYASRKHFFAEYLENTPQWIIDQHRNHPAKSGMLTMPSRAR